MNIDGTIINAEPEDIITELRAQLAKSGIQKFAKIFDSGDDLMICCPYHKEGQERNPSAGIRKSDGLFHCLACGETHALTEMISDCLGYNNPILGYKWLIQNFATTEVSSRGKIIVNYRRLNNDNVPDISSPKISEEELDNYRYIHPYLYERGLTDEIIEKFDIGYDKATDSITFPVRDNNGDCMFVARRSVKTHHFDLPKGITKPLYGMYELTHTKGFGVKYPTKLYICEGTFDCLRFWCNDKLAVAGFGCLFNTYQIKQIQDLPIRTVVIATDNDKAGYEANNRLRKLLTNKVIKEVIWPEGRKDAGECTDEEIQNLKEVL
jgi:DNA primase